jgi:hypothetical protein
MMRERERERKKWKERERESEREYEIKRIRLLFPKEHAVFEVHCSTRPKLLLDWLYEKQNAIYDSFIFLLFKDSKTNVALEEMQRSRKLRKT